jgi:hypothetical protein
MATLELPEHRMRHKSIRNFDDVPKNVHRSIGIFFAADVASHSHFLRQHGKRRVRIGFAKSDLMRIGSVVPMMEALVLAEYYPEVVALGKHVALQGAPQNLRRALRVVCSADPEARCN